jgi:hypothetical protein
VQTINVLSGRFVLSELAIASRQRDKEIVKYLTPAIRISEWMAGVFRWPVNGQGASGAMRRTLKIGQKTY